MEIVQSKEGPPTRARRGKYSQIYDHLESLPADKLSEWFTVEFDTNNKAQSCADMLRLFRSPGMHIDVVTRKRPDHKHEVWYRRNPNPA